MHEDLNEALRRLAFTRMMRLIPAGYGICPGCLQQKAVLARQRILPGEGKERCLDCWKAER